MIQAAKLVAGAALLVLTVVMMTAAFVPAGPASVHAVAPASAGAAFASTLPPGATPAAFPPGCEVPCTTACCSILCGGHGGNLATCVNGRPICRCRP